MAGPTDRHLTQSLGSKGVGWTGPGATGCPGNRVESYALEHAPLRIVVWSHLPQVQLVNPVRCVAEERFGELDNENIPMIVGPKALVAETQLSVHGDNVFRLSLLFHLTPSRYIDITRGRMFTDTI